MTEEIFDLDVRHQRPRHLLPAAGAARPPGEPEHGPDDLLGRRAAGAARVERLFGVQGRGHFVWKNARGRTRPARHPGQHPEPRPIATPIFGKLGLSAEGQKGFEEQMASQSLLKRVGTPLEVAHLARFLLSEDSSYVIGADVTVDGGVSLT